jgi:methyl-accepting chemotaxis protein
MFRRLKIWHKLALMVVPVALVAVFLGVLVIEADHEQVTRSRSELAGARYLDVVPRLLRPLGQHERYAALALNGDAAALAEMRESAAAVDAELEKVARLVPPTDHPTEIRNSLTAIGVAWRDLRDNVLRTSALDSESRHRALFTAVTALGKQVADRTELTTTSLQDGLPLNQALIVWMPRVVTNLSTLRARGSAVVGRGAALADDVLVLAAVGESAREAQREVEDLMLSAFESNRRVRLDLFAPNKRAGEVAGAYRALVQQRMRSSNVTVKPQEHQRLADRAVDEYLALYAGTHETLTGLIAARERRAELERNVAFAGTALALLLAVVAAWWVSRGIRRQVADVERTLAAVGRGDLRARADVLQDDELGRMAASLNAMFENTLSLVQSKQQRDRMQAAIVKLLGEVSGVAEGDLTREAEVSADMTGSIADAFNYMIVQLRQIIGDVKRTSLFVSDSAAGIQAAATRLAVSSERQSSQIVETSAAVAEMAVSIRHVYENATASSSVAEQARANAEQGTHAVQRTMQGMEAIRERVQESSKRLKRLGESSQEIGEIVQLIGDIADRTSILALNASIQASLAGDAGRGFAVVAEEVERLAERATESTRRIATLVKTTQGETAGALSAMEDTTREVVAGSALAREAGVALEEIQKVSNRLAELIASITGAAERQARGSDVVTKAMSSISGIAQHTTSEATAAAVAVATLAERADALRASVLRFTLPAEDRVSSVQDAA